MRGVWDVAIILLKIDEEVIRQVGEKKQMVLDQAKANIIKAQLKQKETYKKNHSCTETYKIGAAVLKKDFLRKSKRWKAGYEMVGSTVEPLLTDIPYNGHLSATDKSKCTDGTYHSCNV